ncbi:hypothetical protein [Anabaena azotica]|uniref:Uncharacterized protein n=1 Tax=Anabaena azotica FACHB-119 TaxID=947527 RepID=A0ABR8D4X2_9NOST|nr:hypothetical protein [Anabaena azotica]MBD2502214.1 hypothetical protein [Anabaena azotica FACHB-119]
MLIFFIHGVAEAKVKFAKPLQHLIKEDFCQRGINPPHFHSGFYADLFNNKIYHLTHLRLSAFICVRFFPNLLPHFSLATPLLYSGK